MTYLKSHTLAPRISGSIWILISVFSLFLITACGGALSLDVNLDTPASRLAARCAPNPFEAECIEKFADARNVVITGCVEDATTTPELCGTATEFVCEGNTNDAEVSDTGNPFAPLCPDRRQLRHLSARTGKHD